MRTFLKYIYYLLIFNRDKPSLDPRNTSIYYLCGIYFISFLVLLIETHHICYH